MSPRDYITSYKSLSSESHSCPPASLEEASRHAVREPMWQGMQSCNHTEFNGANNLSARGHGLLPAESSDENAVQPAH